MSFESEFRKTERPLLLPYEIKMSPFASERNQNRGIHPNRQRGNHDNTPQIRNLVAAIALTITLLAHAAEPTTFPAEGHVQDPSAALAEDGMYYLTGGSNINTLDPRQFLEQRRRPALEI